MRPRPTAAGERGEARRRRREVERRLAEVGLAAGPRRLSAAPSPDDSEAVAKRLAAVLPDLGPVLASFGRYLALRADLFAPAERRWFQHVVAAVPAADASVVRETVAAALGADIDDLFASFSDHPRRVGLTVQVHPAITAGGAPVEVHVARPGAADELRRELPLVPRVLAVWPHPLPVEDLVAGFRDWTAAGADLAGQADGLAALAEDVPLPGLPAVEPVERHLTADGVLTLGELGGRPLPRVPPRAGDPGELARGIARAWLAAALIGPRPWSAAELRRLGDGRLVLGAARFAAAPAPAAELRRYVGAVASGDVDRAAVELLDLVDPTAEAVPAEELRRALRQEVPGPDGRRDGDPDGLAESLLRQWRLVRRHGYRPRQGLADFYRGLAWLEGELRSAAPLAGQAIDPLRESFEDVQWAVTWADTQRFLEPGRLAEAFGQTLDGLILAPPRLQRWLDRRWSDGPAGDRRWSGHAEPPSTAGGAASDSTVAAGALAAAMLAVALAAPQLAAVAGPWAERLAAFAFLALGALFLGALGGGRRTPGSRTRRRAPKEER